MNRSKNGVTKFNACNSLWRRSMWKKQKAQHIMQHSFYCLDRGPWWIQEFSKSNCWECSKIAYKCQTHCTQPGECAYGNWKWEKSAIGLSQENMDGSLSCKIWGTSYLITLAHESSDKCRGGVEYSDFVLINNVPAASSIGITWSLKDNHKDMFQWSAIQILQTVNIDCIVTLLQSALKME